MSFPDNCIRGIKHSRYINNDGTVTSDLFYFDLSDSGDGWSELSINWEDEPNVVSFTLKQEREGGELRFKGGAAILPREKIDMIKNYPLVRGILSYERSPDIENDNPFHGNILIKSQTLKNTMKQVAANLALAVRKIEPQKNSQS